MKEPIKYESALPALLTQLLGSKTTTASGGGTQTESSNADTAALRSVFASQNAMNTPEGMQAALSELFTRGAMEVPGLTQAFANASGTRTTGNSGLKLALGELNKNLAGKAGELLQANMANSAQTGNAIANATKTTTGTKSPSTSTATTGMGNPSNALLTGLLGTAANFADKKNLFGKLGDKASSFFSGPMDFANNFNTSGGVLDTGALGSLYDSYDFQDVPAALAGSGVSDLAGAGSDVLGNFIGSLGDFGSSFSDLGSGIADVASDAASSLTDSGSDFIDFGEFFADGGLVDTASIRSAHKVSMESKLTKQLPSGGAPGYADGGLVTKGNIDLNNRPRVKNKDGSISTVRSMGVNIDGKEVLIPTVSDDGRIMSDDESVQQYRNTGKHLGIFDSVDSSNRYAEQLHNDQAKQYVKPRYADGGEVTSVVRNRNNMGPAATRQGSGSVNYSSDQVAGIGAPLVLPTPRTSRARVVEEAGGIDSSGGGSDGGNTEATAVDAAGGANALLGSLAGGIFGLAGSLAANAMGLSSIQSQAVKAASSALGLGGDGGGITGFGGSSESGFGGSNAGGSGMGFDGSGNTLGMGPSGLDGSSGESGFGVGAGVDGGVTGDVGGGYGGTSGSGDAGTGDMGGGFGGDSGSGDSGGGDSGGGDSGGWVNGGEIDGPGTGTSDSIHARLSDGEFVMSADVVSQLGSDFFQKLQDTFHTPAAQQRASK